MLPFQNKRPGQRYNALTNGGVYFPYKSFTHFISTWLLYELPGRADTCDEKYLVVWNFKEIKKQSHMVVENCSKKVLLYFFSYFVLIIFSFALCGL